MTYYPLTPQWLEPGVQAPAGAPQTQFLSEGDPESIKAAAAAALTAYATASAAGVSPIPPAQVATLQPAGTVAS